MIRMRKEKLRNNRSVEEPRAVEMIEITFAVDTSMSVEKSMQIERVSWHRVLERSVSNERGRAKERERGGG